MERAEHTQVHGPKNLPKILPYQGDSGYKSLVPSELDDVDTRAQLPQNAKAEQKVRSRQEPQHRVARKFLSWSSFLAIGTVEVFVEGGEQWERHRLLLGE